MHANVSVSEPALVARINRKLAHEGQRMLRCRWDSQWFGDLGRYYMVDECNHIKATSIDLEQWAREEVAVLRPDEYLSETK